MSSSVFEDPKHGDPKSAEAISGADTVSMSEPPQREELSTSQAKSDMEGTKNSTMEVSSVETIEDLKSKGRSSQSKDVQALIPMELDLSVPSSGASTAQQTPDSSQTPLIVSNEQQGLETKPASAEESEKDKAETSGEESKEKEQRAGLLNSDLDDKGVASELHKKEEVLKESSVDVGTLAEQETVLYVEKSSVGKTKKSDTRDIGKSSTEGNAQEEAKLSEGDKDTEMAVEQKAASGEKSEVDTEPEKMEIDAVSTDTSGDVKVGETAIIGSPAPPNNFTTSSADSGAMPAQSLPAVETKRPPLTAEQQAKKKELMDLCIRALEYCLRRFPQHHKSRYRLAYVYYYSSEHKVTQQLLCHAS